MLQVFHAGGESAESEEVRKAASRLEGRSAEIFRRAARQEPAAIPWWKAALQIRSVAQTFVGLAAVLLVAAAVITFRASNRPSLNAVNHGEETLRTGNFSVISPAGDLQERPEEIRWEKVQNAATYQVRLLEVDRSEIWSATTTEDHIDLPASIRARIVSAKTLFCEINAFDSAGARVGRTGLVRFRLVQDRK